ncbi:MAG: hypothetical protein ABI885_24465 [Gammaproteobacteria bacterium]
MTDEGFIPYLVIVRFDKGEGLRDRLEESLPLMSDALSELGNVEPVTSSYDGSSVTYLLEAHPDLQPAQVVSQLQSPKSRKVSPLKTQDKVLVVAVQCAVASRLERVTEWLRERELLV